MDFELDRGIAVRAAGDREYAAHLDGGWVVGGGVNGGYLLAVLGSAISAELAQAGQPDPVTVSAYYLTPSVPGPAVVRVRHVRTAKRRSTVAASLVQHHEGMEVERVTALAVFSDHSRDPGEVLRQQPPPDLPPLEQCVRSGPRSEEERRGMPLLARLDTRLDPAYAGFAVGRPSGTGLVQGWFRFADQRPVDPLALLMVVDSLPPATFDLGLAGWAPTLELTAHVRARPAPGWLAVRHATRTVSHGYFEEDCEVWDEAGRLVAQSRQLALVPRIH